MSKKLLAIPGSILLVAIFLLLFFLFKNRNTATVNVLKAVPVNAALLFETNDLERFLHQINQENKIWKELMKFEEIDKIDRNILFLDSLIQNVKSCKELLHKNPVYVSAHQTGNERVGLIWYMNLPKGIQEKNILDLVKEVNTSGTLNRREYNRNTINIIKAGRRELEFSLCVSNGILMFSPSPILLEEAIRQLDLDEGILNSYAFRQVVSTAGKTVDGNLYVNFKRFSEMLSILLNGEHRSLIEESATFREWAELDVNIKGNSVLLNGFTYGSDSAITGLNLFSNQSSSMFKAEEVLPANTIAYLNFGISDFEKFQKQYERFLGETGRLNAYQNGIEILNNSIDPDLREKFYSLLEDEIGVALTDIKNFNRAENSLVFFKTRSGSEAEDILMTMIRNYAQKRGENVSKYRTIHRIDAETQFPVYQFPISSLPEKLFGRFFGAAEYRYFTFIDNFLFFGNSTTALDRLVHNNVLRKTLKNDLLYKAFADNLSSRSNFQLYVKIPRLETIISPYAKPSLIKGIEKHSESLKKIQAFAVQFSVDKSKAYNNLFLKFHPVIEEEAITVWESMLDTSISFKPHFVENHYTHDKEIFVQDNLNNIYLINSAGRILWKVKIAEKIMGEVFQIDYYKNNKLQILFNTRNQIHLIDRNGNYVERYPIPLRSAATNSLSVFDYDKSRDYRFFVAGEDRKVYAYSKEGNIVRGWTFNRTEGVVTSPIQHFRIGNKDYIVFADQLKIYILDRRGNTRVKLNERIPQSPRNNISLDYLPGSSGPRMVLSDSSGTVHFITFTGRVTSTKIKEFSKNHFFDLEDIDGNGSNDLIFLDEGRLEVFAQNRARMFSYSFDQEIDLKPVCYTFSSTNKKIGVVSRLENRIYLINNDGELYQGFPLTGNTLFSIGRFKSSGSRYNLIVGNIDNFLYNYSVQ